MLGLWLLLLILTRIEAAWVSTLRPMTALEREMPLWPPTAPLPAWLERVLIAPWARWDALWYARIVAHGHQAGDGTTQFYPLYPLLAVPLARLGVPPLMALTLVGLAAGLGAVLRFERLAREEMNPIRARRAAAAFMLFPVAFILFAPYAEGIFLMAAIGCFHALRQKRDMLAGSLAGLAALARPQGLFLLLPLAWALWRERRGRRSVPALLAALLPPLGWHAYRILVVEGLPPLGGGFNALLYAFLFSPHAHQVVPVQAFRWPWEALALALRRFGEAPDVDLGINLTLAAGFLTLTALAWKGMHGGERLYTLAVVASALSYHTGWVHPYMGLPRHLWVAFPVFLGLARASPRLLHVVPIVEAPGLFFLVIPYVLEAWVP
jgi:hypothetical protein